MISKRGIAGVAVLCAICLSGCEKEKNVVKVQPEVIVKEKETETIACEETESVRLESGEETDSIQSDVKDGKESQEALTEENETDVVEVLNFVDVFGEQYEVEIISEVEKHPYLLECFKNEESKLSYEGDAEYTYRLGVDVSHHQGVIDWKKVKAAGYDFAFLRIGYRGYGKEGKVLLDRQFTKNIQDAQEAGLDVGVYFFAQAINEEEAREEAEFVIKNLQEYEVQLPVVYDPESILDAEARTDGVSGEQFTKNTIVFCERIKEAGYEPMIYSNMLWEAYEFDLEKLSEYPIWYADYELLPQTPYHFEFWQYSSKGNVDGISGNVDLDIQMIPVDGK